MGRQTSLSSSVDYESIAILITYLLSIGQRSALTEYARQRRSAGKEGLRSGMTRKSRGVTVAASATAECWPDNHCIERSHLWCKTRWYKMVARYLSMGIFSLVLSVQRLD